MSRRFLNVAEQASRIEQDCERAAIRDALVSANWHKYNLALGLTSTVTAAIAGFVAGGGRDWLAGVIDPNLVIAFFALLAAILSSTLTFLAPAEKANAYQQTSNKYHSLRERIRFFVNSKCSACKEETEAAPALRDELEAIILAKHEIDVEHPVLPEWAYRRAHEKLREKIERNIELDNLRVRASESSTKDVQ